MSDIDPVITVLVFAWIVGFAAAGAMLAVRRRRRPKIWALFGAILGPAALALLELGPPGRCWSCDAPTRGWESLCANCGKDVREAVGDLPSEDVRIEEPLTIADGPAPGAPIRGARARSAIGGTPGARSSSTPNAPAGLGRRTASPMARSTRPAPPARSPEPPRKRRGPPPVRGSGQ